MVRCIGINYDAGTKFGVAESAPNSCHGYDVADCLDRDFHKIATELHCNTVQLFGTDVGLLAAAAARARSIGLQVWVQPRLVDATADQQLAHLWEAAGAAEAVRQRYGGVVLTAGVEATLFVQGFVPGETVTERMAHIFDPETDRGALESALDAHLAEAEVVARSRFHGQVTYAAGMWEPVRWDVRFDMIGLDLYVRPMGHDEIRHLLEQHRRVGKPTIVTEYGCVTHPGGLGAFGADVVDWNVQPPRLVQGVVRSEEAQAEGIAQQFKAISASGVQGAICFVFLEPRYHRRGDGDDLDAASFGVVRAVNTPAADGSPYITWTAKAAYRRLAELHRSATTTTTTTTR
jgi:hypothetical protein